MNAPRSVEVRCRFNGAWAPGFEIAEQTGAGYRLRRLSDGAVLPEEFPSEDVRAATEPFTRR